MDPRLLEACMSGDEQALQALIRHDPMILDRAVTCCEETPLHVAVLRGHLTFVRALLSLRRELASERDASGCVPLHLASAVGGAGVVCELLGADAELCNARDHCGRTPLHLAVMKGRLDVVRELIRAHPESASGRVGRGETVFHLSIKYCSLEAVKWLVELLKDDCPQLLVATNDEGNTVLHYAAIFKQIETVRYLLTLEEVKAIANATNGNGHTALDDVMEKSARDFNSFEVMEALTQAGVGRGRVQSTNPTIVVHSPPPPPHNPVVPPPPPPRTSLWSRIKKLFYHVLGYITLKHQIDWIADAHGNLMVVATVIASMSFQAGINPPGGVWQADTIDKHNCTKPDMCRAGTAVLRDANGFEYFYSCNTWALMAAVGVILLHFGGFPLKNKVGTWLMTITTCLMLDNILGAYIFSTVMMVSGGNETLLGFSYVWRYLLMLIESIHIARIWYWLMFEKLTSFVNSGSILCRCKWMRIVVFFAGTIFTVMKVSETWYVER